MALKKRGMAAAVVVAVVSAGAVAEVNWTFSDGTVVQPAYTAGSGPNASLLVVDFQDGTWGAFEYLWDGAGETGWDLIQGVGVEKGQPNPSGWLEYEYTDWGWGISIDSFGHGGSYYNGWNWVYYASDNATGWFPSSSMIGVADRTLADESMDGWSWHANGWGTGDPPIPEPTTVALLAAGAAALLRRRQAVR